ncbi:MAG TPA: hypothetical protein PK867_00015 [Pirellulales bacterium]|nr:hypothetical protein [Pirellulales bacterium]
MTAVDSNGESLPSGEESATVTSTNQTLNVNWEPLAGATGYRIYRGTAPTAENTLVGVVDQFTTSLTDPGALPVPIADTSGGLSKPSNVTIASKAGGNLAPLPNPSNPNSSKYFYRITALSASGETFASVEVSANTTTTDQTLSLSWNPVAGAVGDPVLGYRIYRSTTSGTETLIATIASVNGAITQFSDAGTASPPAADGTVIASPSLTSAIPETGGQLQPPSGGAYYYVVTALDAQGETPPDYTSEQVVTAIGTTFNAVQLTWGTVLGATGYRVYRGTTAFGEDTLIAILPAGTTSYKDIGGPTFDTPPSSNTTGMPAPIQEPIGAPLAGGSLMPTTTYYYVVTAANANGETLGSNEQSATTTATNLSLPISWKTPVQTAGVLLGYRIYRGTAPGQENVLVGVVPATASTFTDMGGLTVSNPPTSDTSGGLTVVSTPTVTAASNANSTLTPGAIYYYKVTATDALGENTPSKEASGTVALAGQQALVLNWTPVPLATGYNIYRGTKSGNENTLIASISGGLNTSFTDDGNESAIQRGAPILNTTVVVPPTLLTVTNGGLGVPAGQYYYVVTAVNALGETVASNELGILFSSANNFNGATLNWTASPGATSYRIYRGTQPGQENLLVGTSFTNSFTENNNNGPLDNTQFWPGINTFPPFTTNTTGIGQPVSDPASSQPGGVLGTTYYYTVTALNANGETLQSNELSAYVSGTNHSAQITWTAVPGAIGYNIYRGTVTGGENTLVANITSGSITTFDDEGPTTSATPPATNGSTLATPSAVTATAVTNVASTLPADTYYYVVTATDAEGESLASTDASPAFTPVTLPAGATAGSATGQGILVSWTAIPFATGYKLYRGTVQGQENVLVATIVGGSSTQYLDLGHTSVEPVINSRTPPAGNSAALPPPAAPTINSVPDGKSTLPANTYYYVVTATDAQGETTAGGESSHAVTAGNALNLAWTAVSGATGYNIYRGTSTGAENVLVASIAATANPSFTDDGRTTFEPPPASDSTALIPPSTPSIKTATDNASLLLTGTTYFYVVTAIDAIGESLPSGEVSLAAGANQALVLSWGQVAGATGYKIYEGVATGAETLLTTVSGGGTTTFTDDGSLLPDGTTFAPTSDTTALAVPAAPTVTSISDGNSTLAAGTYYYVVTATDAQGETTASGETSQTVTAGHALNLTWTAVNGATGYNIYRGTATGQEDVLVASIAATANPFFKDAGNETTFDAPPATNGSGVPRPGQVVVKALSDATSTLPAGTYYYVVTAFNAQGETTGTIENSGTTVAVPGAEPQALALSWSEVVGATGYRIYRGISAGVENVLVATINNPATNAWTDDGTETTSSATPPATNTAALLAPTVFPVTPVADTNSTLIGTYYYVVTALEGQGETNASTVVSATALAGQALSITWSPVTGATGYRVYRGTTAALQDELIATIANGAITTFTDDGTETTTTQSAPANNSALLPPPGQPLASLNAGGALTPTTYYYVVTALDAAGESLGSTELSATTSTSFEAVDLTWSGVPGATSYNIYRGTASGKENVLIGTVYYTAKAGAPIDSGSSTYSFLDDGSTGTAQNPPLVNSASGDRVPGITRLSATLDYGAAGLLDGQTFTISNGTITRTFEFDDNNQLDNTTDIPVTFKPSDTAAQIAQDMIAAINGPGWNVYAATSDASNNNLSPSATNHGNPSDTQGDTSDQVNLFNAAWVEVGPAQVNIEGILSPPPQIAPVAASSGGALATGKYYYVVTALAATGLPTPGETTASNEESVRVTGPGGEVTVNWDAVAGATGYKVYRGTSAGGENVLVGTASAAATSFLDTGAPTPAGTPPTVNNTQSTPHSTTGTALDTGLDSGSDPLLHPIVLANSSGGSFAPSTTYDYVVSAVDAAGKVYRSAEQSFTTSTGTEELLINWDPMPGAVS